MKQQAFNPFLPLDTYIPDGEPHVFGDRVYLYGSHDKEGGNTFCMLGYEVWSAPVDDLGNWTSLGIVFSPKDTPYYCEERPYLYVPDCVRGNDGRYYLYCCPAGDKGKGGYDGPLLVAVSDAPDGKFTYLGEVKHPDGTPFQDCVLFDPAVINDGGVIRLYGGTGLWGGMQITRRNRFVMAKIASAVYHRPPEVFGGENDPLGPFMLVLDDDMMTVRSCTPHILPVPSKTNGFLGHAFYEGASIRKIGDTYYFLIVLMTMQGLIDNFKGGNVQYYYVQYLLGGATHPEMQMLYSIATGVPLGIGIFAIWPLAKKFGIKNVTVVGYAIALISSIVGWIFADNMVVALVAGFFRNIGWMPNSYIFITLLYYAYDDIDFRSHIRVEGLLGVGIVTALQNLIYAPVAGGYESLLLNKGFVDNLEVMPVPSQEIKDFMAMSFYLFDIILGAAMVILLPFVNVEKKLPKINEELLRRKKEAVLAKGGVWLEPEEQDRIEREQAAKEHEENRIADLRELCAKKGLDFETENNKYLAAEAEKEKKREEKEAKKKAKQEAKAAKKKK